MDEAFDFTFSASDPALADQDAGFDYLITWGDGTWEPVARTAGNGAGVIRSHTFDDMGTYEVKVRATDKDGAPSEVASFSIFIDDVPVARAGGPYTVAEGGSVTLDGSQSSDGVDPFNKLTLAWDLDGDGIFGETGAKASHGDETGAHPVFVAGSLDGPQDYTVGLRVTDTNGHTGATKATISLTNVAPTAFVSGPAGALRGAALNFNFSASDVSAADSAAGFAYLVNWGDGTSEPVARTAGNGGGVTLSHAFANGGAFTVTVTATDKDGATSKTASTNVSIAAVSFSDGVLEVAGSSGRDRLEITYRSADVLGVRINNVAAGEYTGVGRVVLYGYGGNDVLQLSSLVKVPAELYGGAGDDSLRAGSGPSILDGGDGNDDLYGGRARDVLVGGLGADLLNGGAEDDILIGGTFLQNQSYAARRAAFDAVLTQWLATTSYANRTTGLSAFLGARVGGDSSRDALLGGAGTDWFFATLGGSFRDMLPDRLGRELVSLI